MRSTKAKSKTKKPVKPKVSNRDIMKLNNLGLSQSSIGEILGCHTTTITHRLTKMGIQPCDTRRSFAEDLLHTLTNEQQHWLSAQLSTNFTIKEFVQRLLVTEYKTQTGAARA